MSSTPEEDSALVPPSRFGAGYGPGSAVGRDNANHGTVDAEETTPIKPPPRKRRRIVISCTECHRRKQKCDRKLPCTNCVSRNKQSFCRYETGAYPTISQRLDDPHPQPAPTTNTTTTTTFSSSSSSSSSSIRDAAKTTTEIALNTFGYTQGSTNTLDFLQQIENASTSATDTSLNKPSDHFPSSPSLDQRYKSLLRQLPPKIYISKLIPIYVREFNWAYAAIDIPYFYSQLTAFHSLPFSALSSPSTVPAELRAFPALLFQMCAVVLLTLAPDGNQEFEGLKYAGGMSFEDLAAEYSDLGVQVLQTLGKRGMSLTTVLAGFVRGSFLKYQGLVTESWHAIGGAIRDGMEIGLHRRRGTENNNANNSNSREQEEEENDEDRAHAERGRRVWMTLVLWDVHMACVLGRPTTVGLDVVKGGIRMPKDDSDFETGGGPPTSLTRAIWGFKVAKPMRDILELEKRGGGRVGAGAAAGGLKEDGFERLNQLHEECLALRKELPACFRLENPDTRFDQVAECWWLPASRVLMSQIMSFQLMALHRPYVFTRRESRREALKASLEMLQAQRLHFSMMKPNMYKTFSLFFGTFDAIVLMASIYILFPREHPDFLHSALQHFQWATERFEAMSVQNALANAALGVLKVIRLKLDRCLAGVVVTTTTTTTAATTATAKPSPSASSNAASSYYSSSSNSIWDNGTPPSTNTSITNSGATTTAAASTAATNPSSGPSPDDSSSSSNFSTTANHDHDHDRHDAVMSEYPPLPPDQTSAGTTAATTQFEEDVDVDVNNSNNNNNGLNLSSFDFSFPTDFDWSSVQPIFATTDLIYGHLSGTTTTTTSNNTLAGNSENAGVGGSYNLNAMATTDTGALGASWANGLGGGGGGSQHPGAGTEWQFEGDFGSDTVWNLFNNFPASAF